MEYTYTKPMRPDRFIERHLITLAVNSLKRSGWRVTRLTAVDYQHEFLFRNGAPAVWEQFETLDSRCALTFTKLGYQAILYLEPGNGVDVISDYEGQIESIMRSVYLR